MSSYKINVYKNVGNGNSYKNVVMSAMDDSKMTTIVVKGLGYIITAPNTSKKAWHQAIANMDGNLIADEDVMKMTVKPKVVNEASGVSLYFEFEANAVSDQPPWDAQFDIELVEGDAKWIYCGGGRFSCDSYGFEWIGTKFDLKTMIENTMRQHIAWHWGGDAVSDPIMVFKFKCCVGP